VGISLVGVSRCPGMDTCKKILGPQNGSEWLESERCSNSVFVYICIKFFYNKLVTKVFKHAIPLAILSEVCA